MTKQFIQEIQIAEKTKKFGKYDIKEEDNFQKYVDEIVFENDCVAEIALRLSEMGEECDGDIIPIDFYYAPKFIDEEYKLSFHIKDTSVSVYRYIHENFYALLIHHKNPAKRKITRKFLEEILS